MGEVMIASFVGAFFGVLSADFIVGWIEEKFFKKPVYVVITYVDEI